MLRVLLAACFLMTAAVAAVGGNKVFPYAYDQHDFPNGLRLITIPTSYPEVVSVFIVVQAGSRNEVEPGKSGFAHLFEHMMFRGTKQYPAAKYQEVLKEAGAASNAYTSDDLTAYHTTFSKEDLEKILRMEADRFQSLEYSPETLKTESLAVLGEYNKNSSSPVRKLFEVLRDTAFDKHTYKHTTMGFLADIENMPKQYDYSRQFFSRYYRPEYTTIVVAGDVQPASVRALVEKYWGDWKRGDYKPEIPKEPPQEKPRTAHVDWPAPTLPWLAISFRSPAYSDEDKSAIALDLIALLGFSDTSDLYQRLVIQEQKVDVLEADYSAHIDPYLFTVLARIKKQEDLDAVQSAILETCSRFRNTLVDAKRLDEVKNHMRYEFALQLDNSETIANVAARFVALRRTPETINRMYDLMSRITPEDIRDAARKYLADNGRTIVTLTAEGRSK